MHRTGIDQTGGARGFNVLAPGHPVDQAWRRGKRALHLSSVQFEPARSSRRSRVRIDGDHLEIDALAHSQDAVVGTHCNVLSTATRTGTESRLDIVLALLQ